MKKFLNSIILLLLFCIFVNAQSTAYRVYTRVTLPTTCSKTSSSTDVVILFASGAIYTCVDPLATYPDNWKIAGGVDGSSSFSNRVAFWSGATTLSDKSGDSYISWVTDTGPRFYEGELSARYLQFDQSGFTDNRTVTWPDITGEVTLLGNNSLSPTGTGGTGFLQLLEQASAPSNPTNAARLFVDSSNRPAWKGENGFTSTFNFTGNTTSRVYSFPNADVSTAGVFCVSYNTQNVGAGETDLASCTIPAGYLTAGKIVQINASGVTAANANAKTVKLYIDATEIGRPINNVAANASSWSLIDGYILGTGAATQNTHVRSSIGPNAIGSNESANNIPSIQTTSNSAGTIVVKITGQGTSTGDVTSRMFFIRLLN